VGIRAVILIIRKTPDAYRYAVITLIGDYRFSSPSAAISQSSRRFYARRYGDGFEPHNAGDISYFFTFLVLDETGDASMMLQIPPVWGWTRLSPSVQSA
jgi:hypothetical protein